MRKPGTIKILSEKKEIYYTLKIDADDEVIKDVCDYARQKIVDDKDTLFSYGFNLMLKEMIQREDKCKKTSNKKSSRP